jgi:hypothetical protein
METKQDPKEPVLLMALKIMLHAVQWLQWLQWGVTFSQVVWLIGC